MYQDCEHVSMAAQKINAFDSGLFFGFNQRASSREKAKRRVDFLMIYLPVYSYFETGCRKNVHATIPKGNMGYDQYPVPDD